MNLSQESLTRSHVIQTSATHTCGL